MTKVAPMGMAALDTALMNGLPKGWTVLVTGTPGVGMDLFAKQFAGAAARDETVVYFATTERDEDVVQTMKDFGWTANVRIVNIGRMYYESVLAKRLEVSRYRLEGIRWADLAAAPSEGSARDSNLLTALTYETSKLQPPFRIVIDSLDFFLGSYGHADVLSALRTVKAHTQREEGVALVTMLSGTYDTRTQSGVEEIVDGVIELERVRDGDSFKRYLVLRKVRNHPEKTVIRAYDLTKDGIAAV